MKRAALLILAFIYIFTCTGCGDAAVNAVPAEDVEYVAPPSASAMANLNLSDMREDMTMKAEKTLHLAINNSEIPVDWEDNASVDALIELVSSNVLSIQLSRYGGFEQVGHIGTALPQNDRQTETHPGDIVLYSGNQLVIFYGSNTWAYTRLGKITSKTEEELAALLGNNYTTVTISWK